MSIKLVIAGALLLLAAGCTISPYAEPAYSYGGSGAYYAGPGVGYGNYYATPGYYGRPAYSGYGEYRGR
jgi:hypothetical protein